MRWPSSLAPGLPEAFGLDARGIRMRARISASPDRAGAARRGVVVGGGVGDPRCRRGRFREVPSPPTSTRARERAKTTAAHTGTPRKGLRTRTLHHHARHTQPSCRGWSGPSSLRPARAPHSSPAGSSASPTHPPSLPSHQLSHIPPWGSPSSCLPLPLFWPLLPSFCLPLPSSCSPLPFFCSPLLPPPSRPLHLCTRPA